MMSKNLVKNKEEVLIRSGDILNSLGVLRSAKINNCLLPREKFIELVKRNYLLHDEVPSEILDKINKVWDDSITLFKKMEIDNGSNPQNIIIKGD